ncbi:Uncharacterised protein [Kluyvera cryocrescens]|nr:Uncharacterised protein [Kluyvera cryocrescens]
MAFPSPANDYVETRLTVDSLCQMDANCTVIQTTTGYAVINRSLRAEQGNIVLITHCGNSVCKTAWCVAHNRRGRSAGR